MSSLTQELADSESPLSVFFQKNLANTKGILDTAVTHPAGFSTRARASNPAPRLDVASMLRSFVPTGAPLPEKERYPWPQVGAAFDYRLRYFVGVTPTRSLVAHGGALRIGDGELAPGFLTLEDAVDRLLAEHDPRGRLLPEPVERLLCSYCYLLALFEACRRASIMDEAWDIVRLGRRGSLDELLGLCDEAYVQDLMELGARFLEYQPGLLAEPDFVLNPRIATSSLVGMDGDLIVGRRLIDVKTTKNVSDFRKQARRHVWQLVGYVLGDSEDQYRLKQAGFYLSRQGVQLFWNLDELLAQLAGAPADLDQLRVEFAAACRRTAVREAFELAAEEYRTTNDATPSSIPTQREPLLIERSLRFIPPASGGTKWHVTCADSRCVSVPEGCDPSSTASCGSAATLDATAAGVWATLGQTFEEADQRFCRRCLKYAEGSWERWAELLQEHEQQVAKRNPDGPPVVEREVPFFPVVGGEGKWHVPQSEDSTWAGLPGNEERRVLPACGSRVRLDDQAAPIVPPVGERHSEADPRLCTRCLRQTIVTW